MKKSKFYLVTVGLLLLVFVAVASVSASTITVTSPNGGETWQRGTTHTVTWSYTDFPSGAPVKIVLLKAGTEVGTIVDSTSIGAGGKGSYTWDINPSGGTGSEYKVKISSTSLPSLTDSSNNYFTLTPAGTTAPTITVTSPNGGESWQRGTTHTVSWSFTGTPGSTVKITLLKAGAEVGSIISSYSIGSGGTGSYTWPIGSSGLTGSDFKVSVQSISQPTIQDTSNNVFTLTPAGTPTPSGVGIKSAKHVAYGTALDPPTGFTIDQCDIIVSPNNIQCPSDYPLLTGFLSSTQGAWDPSTGKTWTVVATDVTCRKDNSDTRTHVNAESNYLMICHS